MLGIYVRVSTKKQLDGYSPKEQERLGLEKARQLGMTHKLYKDLAVSATKDSIKDRPELIKLINDIQSKEITAVYITEVDRIIRNNGIREFLIQIFKKHKVILHTADGQYDLDNPMSKLIFTVLSAASEFETEIKKIRFDRGLQAAMRKGKFKGVLVPFGYRKNKSKILEIDNEEAEVYKEMVKMSMSGVGTRTIAKRLNELGIETRGRKVLKKGFTKSNRYTKDKTHVDNDEIVWKAGTVYTILTNPIYKGERTYKGEPIDIAAIISDDNWQKLQENLRTNQKNSPRNNVAHFYLLKGLLRCGHCNSNLYGRTRPDKKDHFYMCSSKREKTGGCGLRSVNIDKLDYVIWNFVLTKSALFSDSIRAFYKEGNFDEKILNAKNELEKLKKNEQLVFKQMERNFQLFDMGEFEKEVLSVRHEKFKRELADAKRKVMFVSNELDNLVELKKNTDLADHIILSRDKYNYTTPIQEQRIIIEKYIRNIVVRYNEADRCHNIEIELLYPISSASIILQNGEITSVGEGKTKFVEQIFDSTKYPRINEIYSIANQEDTTPPIVTKPSHWSCNNRGNNEILFKFKICVNMDTFRNIYTITSIKIF